jgi:hypothetical protein
MIGTALGIANQGHLRVAPLPHASRLRFNATAPIGDIGTGPGSANPPVLFQFIWSLSSPNQAVGATFGVTLTAQDNHGSTITSWNNTATISFGFDTSPGISGTPGNFTLDSNSLPADVTFTNGVYSGTAQCNLAGTLQLQAVDDVQGIVNAGTADINVS